MSTLDEYDEEIESSVGALLDLNSKQMKILRSKANKMFILADAMEEVAQQYRRIGGLYVLASQEHARILADTLDAEYDITEEEDDDEEDAEDS